MVNLFKEFLIREIIGSIIQWNNASFHPNRVVVVYGYVDLLNKFNLLINIVNVEKSVQEELGKIPSKP